MSRLRRQVAALERVADTLRAHGDSFGADLATAVARDKVRDPWATGCDADDAGFCKRCGYSVRQRDRTTRNRRCQPETKRGAHASAAALDPQTQYESFVAQRGRRGKIPDFGYAVTRAGEYDAFFDVEVDAQRAAHLLVKAYGSRVDIVKIQGHGADRFIVGQVEPRSWRST